ALLLHGLLAQEVEPAEHLRARRVRVELHVVTGAVRGEEAIDAAGGEQPPGDDLVEELVRLGEGLARLLAVFVVLKDRGVDALELPRVEERRPVDELAQRRERKLVEHPYAGELGRG